MHTHTFIALYRIQYDAHTIETHFSVTATRRLQFSIVLFHLPWCLSPDSASCCSTHKQTYAHTHRLRTVGPTKEKNKNNINCISIHTYISFAIEKPIINLIVTPLRESFHTEHCSMIETYATVYELCRSLTIYSSDVCFCAVVTFSHNFHQLFLQLLPYSWTYEKIWSAASIYTETKFMNFSQFVAAISHELRHFTA